METNKLLEGRFEISPLVDRNSLWGRLSAFNTFYIYWEGLNKGVYFFLRFVPSISISLFPSLSESI